MGPTEQLRAIVPALIALVDRIEPRQLDDPTPCREFTVRDVLHHMMGLGGRFAYWFRGEDPPEADFAVVDSRVPAAEFRAAMNDLLDAVASPGAMERTITAPMGQLPGSTFARFVAFDGLVHGWDLASATGQDYHVPPAVVAAVDAFARTAITSEMRDGDTFAAETAAGEGATAIERLVAFSGRSI